MLKRKFEESGRGHKVRGGRRKVGGDTKLGVVGNGGKRLRGN